MMIKDSIIIRTVNEEDLSLLYKWNSQQARGSYQEFQFDSLVSIKKNYNESGFNSDKFKMLIIEIENVKPIGLVYISFVRQGLVRIGLVICEENFRSGGFGAKSTKMIVNHLFDNYPIMRIEAETDNENIGAQKVLEKSGFTREGILRSYRYHHNQWRDFVLYSILNNEKNG